MGKHYYATGRGGAGNIQSADKIPHPNEVPQGSQTPNLLQPVFSTGRGGAGNMIKNKDPELTRKLQDVDQDPEDYISPVISGQQNPNANMSFGRGGFGNMISPKNSANANQQIQREKVGTSKSNEKANTSSKNEGGFFKKAKSLFKK
ncbi:hypothetical protein BN7_3759 [Wickerhamomyces ciferrii]|uniref:Uncharacterized protein n=1 Tax=Wickerhamomyces ciferrii (strain ATCC 14091 / BCRC 22168 / CBS 111 / JCM 3599 / NBRC 0793 / NRRL Y-1031 F-60-10) TaxID=1206466 RepID=K0KGB2_WICCF|nr:uncharacterized protein BN7_3759 [Wickerhamomyces ciferrii]CCH44200.1 hypothetical protein BN7_3759 [Wickerhamomyces ciferrii]